MKHLFYIVLLIALTTGLSVSAKNTVVKTEQVTSAVTLSGNIDYTITGTTPFAVTGSINITNTEHAVVILENIRPSKALAQLGFITINGEAAVNDENCQVKMYAQGSIILPYDKDFKPLTVYSGTNFSGESVNNFGLENSGGFMNTLTAAKLNNRIRSFKLKRGYMVTFATSAGGRGYSRCFIADDEDLEIASLPKVLDQKISSYRVFKWNNAEKKGLANSTSYDATQALNVSWCYSFGLGEDRGMDCECVPHHIYENWPSPEACGQRTYSPHMKTNNEPGNDSDDHPQTVDEILANWENLMRTGMRLCSPSSHDGSLNHLWAFMDSIDARGWRCDILDIHSYWTEGQFGNLNTWYNRYKRPIWISEWVWGSSWGHNGAFASNNQNDDATYNGTLPILSKLNSWEYVERYAYWNSEQWYSKIYRDGELTRLGRYYADMKSGLGYNKAYEYIPRFVYKRPHSLKTTYVPSSKRLDITWNNPNGEQTDSAYIETKDVSGNWVVFTRFDATESTEMSFSHVYTTPPAGGTYTFRIHTFDSDGQQRLSGESEFTVGGAQGKPGFQYGHVSFTNTSQVTTYLTPFDEEGSSPYVFLGMPTNNNPDMGLLCMVNVANSTQFRFTPYPWQIDYSTTMVEEESVDFFSLAPGNYTYGDMKMEVGQCPGRIGSTPVEVSFSTPFNEGVTPVVFVQAVTNIASYPFTARAYDVTSTGFSVKLERQSAVESSNFTSQKVNYIAITPGSASMGEGKRLSAGISTEKIGGNLSRYFYFTQANGEKYQLKEPYILAGAQTHNTEAASLFRVHSPATEQATVGGESFTATIGFRTIRQVDSTSGEGNGTASRNGDLIGWIAVSDDTEKPTSIRPTTESLSGLSVWTEGRTLRVKSNNPYTVHNMAGIAVQADVPLLPGIYIVKSGNDIRKVILR